MILDEKIYMEEDYKKEQRVLIEPLLKYYINVNYSNTSLNVPQFYKIIAQLVATLIIIIFIIVTIIVQIVKKCKKKKDYKKSIYQQIIEYQYFELTSKKQENKNIGQIN